MASLLLSVVGAAVGGAVFGPIGAVAGRLVGALAGNAIDHAVLSERRDVAHTGPRLHDLNVMASTEGAPIPRLYGRARLSGEVIWATELEEVVTEEREQIGGPIGGVEVVTTTYSYFANFAVGLCEGEVAHITRIWADGKPLDLSMPTVRFYDGSQVQTADPLIVAKEGSAPAYRGLAYVVFERLPLEDFGNRIPQLSFEVVRPVGRLEQRVRAVTLIPGTTEFGYEPTTVLRLLGPGQAGPENRHVVYRSSDVIAALDELHTLCPNLERVAIVTAWFGTDLRAQLCALRPGVEAPAKLTFGASWSVDGVNRLTAHLVSTFEGRAAYGGTPSDGSVRNLIAHLKGRGLKVTLYPFVMMDIPAGNALTDPWTGAASQPPHPWRGRITCDPAPGQPGSPDGTAAAADQIDAFFSGEWGYRRMILHYAELAADAGGVDAFLIGSELRSLTRVRSAPGVYPMVDRLVGLAGEVKAILGAGTVVTYGADWTEYGSHVVDAAANEVRFPLDPLWASSSIDAIGIDYYAPLSDWRDGANHLDRALASAITDRAYLTAGLSGGEGFDWYYPDATARATQARSAITDTLGKPWVFRQKDIWSFWGNAHYERVGGAELPTPTAWAPQSKPVWLTEVGCPAVDKGTNQPSVFPDPKSSENFQPHFSSGRRDDLIQRRHLECFVAAFDPAFGADALNPVSAVYGGRMVDPTALHLWTWDARPYPVFPAAISVWGDGPNWETGHWLTGRFGSAPMEELVSAILADCGVTGFDASALGEGPEGYVIDRPMSARTALEPLAAAYAFEAAEHSGVLKFRPRGGLPVAELTEDDLVLPKDGPPFRLTRAQETELPREASLGYTDAGAEYRRAIARSRRLVVGAARVAHAELAAVTSDIAAERRAEIWLQDVWAGREAAEFQVPASRLSLAPGDVVGLTLNGRRRLVELREIVDAEHRGVRARSIDPEVFELPLIAPRRRLPATPLPVGPVHALTLDLPMLGSEEPPVLTRIAVFADPWPGPVAIWRSSDGLSFVRAAQALAPAVVGETLDDLPAGTARGIDHRNQVRVLLYGGALASVSDSLLSGGANAAAVRTPGGACEVLQFGDAELLGARSYRLSRLVRGLAGSEWAMADPLPAGAPFVLLNPRVVPLARGFDGIGVAMQLRIIAAGRDHGDPAAVSLAVTPSALALRPLAPVHLLAVRTGAGVVFSWVRRTRLSCESWEIDEIPLGEDVEAYELDVLSGATVLRTLTSNGPSVLYASADEIADFGAPQAELSVRVAQLSATVGRGIAAAAVLQP
jgi:hypothetical protein